MKRIEGEDDLGDGVRIGVGMALPGLGHRHRTLHQPHRSLGLRRLQVTSTANMAVAVLFLHLSLRLSRFSLLASMGGSLWRLVSFTFFVFFPMKEVSHVCREHLGLDQTGPDEPG